MNRYVLTERNIKCENATKKRRALKYNNQLLSVTGVYNLWVSINIRCNPISDISCKLAAVNPALARCSHAYQPSRGFTVTRQLKKPQKPNAGR